MGKTASCHEIKQTEPLTSALPRNTVQHLQVIPRLSSTELISFADRSQMYPPAPCTCVKRQICQRAEKATTLDSSRHLWPMGRTCLQKVTGQFQQEPSTLANVKQASLQSNLLEMSLICGTQIMSVSLKTVPSLTSLLAECYSKCTSLQCDCSFE